MSGVEDAFSIETSRGETAALLAVPAGAHALVALGHGAGAGMGSPFMQGIARALRDAGVATLLFDFPYMHAGRRSPDPAPALVATWRAVAAAAGERTDLPIVVGGKSLGGRIASIAVSEGMAAHGLVFLGYPLHPPGRPDRVRDEHLDRVSVPMLFVQGTRDAFARPDLLAAVLGRLGDRARIVTVDGGDHSFRVPGGERDGGRIGAGLAGPVAEFVESVAGRAP